MQYIKVTGDQKIYPYNSLYADNPNVSFPSPLTPDVLAMFGVFEVLPTQKPECPWYQFVEETTPVFEDGSWQQVWVIHPRPTDEVNKLVEEEWVNLRAERNRRLTECDWTQLSDSPVDSASWAVYRQELRDLPQNTTNPYEVQWPPKPE